MAKTPEFVGGIAPQRRMGASRGFASPVERADSDKTRAGNPFHSPVKEVISWNREKT